MEAEVKYFRQSEGDLQRLPRKGMWALEDRAKTEAAETNRMDTQFREHQTELQGPNQEFYSFS